MKDAVFLTATFLAQNWLLPHFLYYDTKAVNSNYTVKWGNRDRPNYGRQQVALNLTPSLAPLDSRKVRVAYYGRGRSGRSGRHESAK